MEGGKQLCCSKEMITIVVADCVLDQQEQGGRGGVGASFDDLESKRIGRAIKVSKYERLRLDQPTDAKGEGTDADEG